MICTKIREAIVTHAPSSGTPSGGGGTDALEGGERYHGRQRSQVRSIITLPLNRSAFDEHKDGYCCSTRMNAETQQASGSDVKGL